MKLYIVTRADLSPGQQAVQAAHALAEYALRRPTEFHDWGNQTLVVLAAEDLTHLSIIEAGWPECVDNREPDLGGALTALAVIPGCAALKRRLKSLPLAFQA